jgi:hypothetical protein
MDWSRERVSSPGVGMRKSRGETYRWPGGIGARVLDMVG